MKITENVKFSTYDRFIICVPTNNGWLASNGRFWHRDCLRVKRVRLSLSPGCNFYEEKEKRKMRVLQKMLFTFAMVVGLSIAASAQNRDDQKKPPPKPAPPVVNPAPTKPPPNKPKKSDSAIIMWKEDSGLSA